MQNYAQRMQSLRKTHEQAVAKLENAKKHKFSPYMIRVLKNSVIVAYSNIAMAEAFANLDK